MSDVDKRLAEIGRLSQTSAERQRQRDDIRRSLQLLTTWTAIPELAWLDALRRYPLVLWPEILCQMELTRVIGLGSAFDGDYLAHLHRVAEEALILAEQREGDRE